jgi:DNA invertase Pin-like site-specific DNA recombinase
MYNIKPQWNNQNKGEDDMNNNKGKVIGYKRVSSIDQNETRQLEGVELDKLFIDKASGKDNNRPQLKAMIEYVREGDTILVHSLDRIGRNLAHIKQLIDDLNAKGVEVRFIKENLSFSLSDNSPLNDLMLNMLGSFAQFERDMIRERQREGIALAKAKGVYKGRKPKVTKQQTNIIKELITGGMKKTEIAKEFNISRQSIYNLAKV